MEQDNWKNQTQSLYERMSEYRTADYLPMHMPGAKRNGKIAWMENPYELDLTEIDGFDNMHHPEEILKREFEKAARLYGAQETFFLVNGSSAGVMAAICGTVRKGGKVLVARNCHKSVYHALILQEAEPVYLYPSGMEGYEDSGIAGPICPEEIETRLQQNADAENPIQAVILTSPTYEGIVSDIRRIAAVCHQYRVPLVVDEAHGAHFAFSEAFPDSAVSQGADLVIQSLHKTLPALTQTALLHGRWEFADRERVVRYWNMFQTTSPSYVLMGSISQCLDLLETRGQQLFRAYTDTLLHLRKRLERLQTMRLFPSDDPGKIVLVVNDGKALYNKLLEDYRIQLEMASLHYVIAMTSVADLPETYERFAAALEEIDRDALLKEDMAQQELQSADTLLLKKIDNADRNEIPVSGRALVQLRLKQAVVPWQAVEAEAVDCGLEQAAGRIAAEEICIYPPGIPQVMAGEQITPEAVAVILAGLKAGLEVTGVQRQKQGDRIRCLK